MKIRTVDSKNRVTVSGEGVYVEYFDDESGVITLHPVKIPQPPAMDGKDSYGVYISAHPAFFRPATVTVHVPMVPGVLGSSPGRWLSGSRCPSLLMRLLGVLGGLNH